jgi:hypothetical protein
VRLQSKKVQQVQLDALLFGKCNFKLTQLAQIPVLIIIKTIEHRDFDWSFINENSDTYVVQQLVPSLVPELKELMRTTFKNQWTALMVRVTNFVLFNS